MEPIQKNIASALVKAQKAFGPALKTSSNPHFRSRYADLSACVEAVIGGLNDAGIALIQQTHDCQDGVCVETIFLHESGESLSAGRLHVPASKHDAQGYGSALTYARRYSLMAAAGIAPEDDDGNAASRPRQEAPKAIKPIKAKLDAHTEPPNDDLLDAPIKAKVDAPVAWWSQELNAAMESNEDAVNAFLQGKGKITKVSTWRDIQDEDYRARIESNIAGFLKAAIGE